MVPASRSLPGLEQPTPSLVLPHRALINDQQALAEVAQFSQGAMKEKLRSTLWDPSATVHCQSQRPV